MSYNFDKDTCDCCGAKQKPVTPVYTDRGVTYPGSFRLGHNGEVWCEKCFKEKELRDLFAMMDRADARNVARHEAYRRQADLELT